MSDLRTSFRPGPQFQHHSPVPAMGAIFIKPPPINLGETFFAELWAPTNDHIMLSNFCVVMSGAYPAMNNHPILSDVSPDAHIMC